MQETSDELASASADSVELGAWLLPVSPDVTVAVGRYELKYIEYINSCVTLPGVPAFCEQGFVWRNRFIPALDIYSLVTRRRMPLPDGEQLAAIIAYENATGTIEMGAILLRGVPKLLSVKPEQSVAISELRREWQLMSQAAFKVEVDVNATDLQAAVSAQDIYPVLDLRALFDNTPVDILSLH